MTKIYGIVILVFLDGKKFFRLIKKIFKNFIGQNGRHVDKFEEYFKINLFLL